MHEGTILLVNCCNIVCRYTYFIVLLISIDKKSLIFNIEVMSIQATVVQRSPLSDVSIEMPDKSKDEAVLTTFSQVAISFMNEFIFIYKEK